MNDIPILVGPEWLVENGFCGKESTARKLIQELNNELKQQKKRVILGKVAGGYLAERYSLNSNNTEIIT